MTDENILIGIDTKLIRVNLLFPWLKRIRQVRRRSAATKWWQRSAKVGDLEQNERNARSELKKTKREWKKSSS